MTAVILVLLLAVPAVGAAVLALLPARAERLAVPVAGAASGVALLLSLVLGASYDVGSTGPGSGVDLAWIPALDSRFVLGVDGISLPLVVLTTLLVALCVLYTARHVPEPGRPGQLLALLLLLEVGVLGTFLALDLLLFFVFFEVVLIPMYFVIAVWGDSTSDRRGPAATKFILYTLLGSVLMLLGFLVVYAETGTFSISELTAAAGAGIPRGVQTLAFGLMLVGFAVKAPLWPLHTWLPDAHTEAPTVGSVLLAGVLLKMGTYGLVRIALPVVPEGARDLAPALGVLAAVSIVYGSLCCLASRDLKRLIAYSSVGHMGFVLLGIATLTPVGVNAALFGNIAHGVITGLLFFLAGSVKDRYHTGDLADIGGGLLVKAPLLAGLMTFACVASLGLPGLAGFWGEALALFGAFEPGAGLSRPLFLVLMVVGGLGTALTAAYFLVLLQRLSFGPVPPRWTETRFADAQPVELAAWAPLLVLTVALGLWPRLVLGVTDAPVRALLGGLG